MRGGLVGSKIGLGFTIAVVFAIASASVARADAYLFVFSTGPQTLTLTMSGGGTVTLSTNQSEFNPGTPNQGWWSPGENNDNFNDNYGVGSTAGEPHDHHNFFTFDLTGLSGTVVSATLNLQRYCGNKESDPSCGFAPGGPAKLPYDLWDVSTDPATLNAKSNSPNFGIYDDLGSGVNYGEYLMRTSGNPDRILNFALDPAAIAAINAAEGGYFSIGGAIPLSSIVPEPSTLVMMGSGLLGSVGLARRKLWP